MKRKQRGFSLVLTLVLALAYALPVYALSDGDSISYKASHAGSGAGTVAKFTVVGDSSFTGCCAEQGVNVTPGEIQSATVGKVSNNTKVAKLLYRYAIDKDWWKGPDAEDVDIAKAALRPYGSNYQYVSITPRRLVEAIAQISNQGKKEWTNAITSSGGWPDWEAELVTDWYDSLDASNITAPDGFILYKLYPSKNKEQGAYIWTYTDTTTGYVKVKKVSGNTSITG